jgi:site-specific recombinase XerD
MPRKKESRRAAGEGSLFKREEDGLWRGYVTTEAADGRQKKIWVSSKKQSVAKEKLDKLKESLRRGNYVSRLDVTLQERLEHWLEYEIKSGVSAGTYEKYHSNIKNHISPVLGKKEIQKITRADMVEFLAEKENQLAPETVKILLSILRRVFDIALIDEIISKSPLLRVSRAKKVEKKKRRILTSEEEIKLLETAQNWSRNKQVYNILFTEYGSGLRRSEIMPLKKSDINFKSRELTINRVYVMVKGVPKLEDRAKSEASQEPLIIPEILANYLATIKTAPVPNDYLFPAKDGNPINPNSFRRTFKRILKVAELDETIRLHDLRHNFASQMVALNVHISYVQAQMRHADIKTTSRYSHTTTEGQKQAAGLINEHLKKIVERAKK